MTNTGFAVLRPGPVDPNAKYAALIETYSPILVLFPETYSAGSPWAKGQPPTDYQPRPVEMYLSQCGLRDPARAVGGPKGWAGGLAVSGVNSALRAIGAIRRPKTVDLKALVTDLYLKRGQEKDPILKGFSLDNGVQKSADAWKKYHALIEKDPVAYRQTSYVTAVPRPERPGLAITYWFFYYFNDYWNRHQADFESVTVFFRPDGAGAMAPTGCGYGAHGEGLYRFWPDVVRPDKPNTNPVEQDTHPIALVGRGSHAFYPGWGGHIPATEMENNFAGKVHYRLALSPLDDRGQAREDSVVIATTEEIMRAKAETYSIQVVPRLEAIMPGTADWENWWWLHYGGLWGYRNWIPIPLVRRPGINGPMQQGYRWNDPWKWVKSCQPDGVQDWTSL